MSGEADVGLTRSTDILNEVWTRVQTMKGFKTYRRGPIMVQTQPEDLPLIAVYLPDCDGTPWTDASIGATCLVESVGIGISAVVIDSRSDAQYQQLIRASEQLDEVFLRDPDFHSFKIMKGIERRRKVTRSMQLAEAPVLELQYTFTISVVNIWEPVISDDLKVVYLKTAIPAGGTAEEQEATQQVAAVWELETTE